MRQGLTLDRRFVLVEREEAVAAGTERWQATDTRLDKPVTVLAVSGDRAAEALAAGNKARIVRDGRLARIVSVFQSDDDHPTTYIAIERPKGTVLADLLERRLLPVPVARAIVAAAINALGAASERGLTGGITTHDVTVSANGKVIVAKQAFTGTEDEIWDLYRTVAIKNVDFKAGKNVIKLVSLEEDGPNLDNITIIKMPKSKAEAKK